MGARRCPASRLRGPRLKLTRVLVLVIRFDDVLNQFVTHDVALVKVYQTDAVDVVDIPHFDQPRDAVRGRSTCKVTVTTALELKPSRSGTFHLSAVAFCASSRMTNESLAFARA